MPAKGQINPAIRDAEGKIVSWKKRNREASNASTRARRAQNHEKARADNLRWRERMNPFSVAVGKARLRAEELHVLSTLTTDEWRRVVEASDFYCHLCGEKTILEIRSPERLSLDHVLPMIRGGENTVENVLPAHRRCNQLRSDMTLEEFDLWLDKVYRKRNGRTKTLAL